jgi:hypothetical protein
VLPKVGQCSIGKLGRRVESQNRPFGRCDGYIPLFLCLEGRIIDRISERKELERRDLQGQVVGQRMPSFLGASGQDSEAVSSDWTPGTTFLFPRPVVQISSGSQVAFHLRRRRLCTWTQSHRAKRLLHGILIVSPKNHSILIKASPRGQICTSGMCGKVRT